jgi:hypothetical protein
LAYPYTGIYQFVLMLKSTEWPISKIYQLARLHAAIIDNLRPLYLENLRDINNVISVDNTSLMQSFYDLSVTTIDKQISDGIMPAPQLVHSIHNTSNKNTKAIFVQTWKYEEAIGQLANIYNILRASVPPAFHHNDVLPDNPPSLTGQKTDSLSSCNYSSYATALLTQFNPQDGEPTLSTPSKRFPSANITYARALRPLEPTIPHPASQPPATLSTIDIDAIQSNET